MHPIERPENMPFDFVVDALERLNPVIGRMFGCYSIYIADKIMLILREREAHDSDNGVWVATTAEHHESLRKDIPSLKDIAVFGPGPTGWQVISVESDHF